MLPIIATIKANDTGKQVANLQDALLALLERGILRSLDEPNRPTLEELRKLTEILKQEHEQSLFGDATRQLVMYFQLQQGLGDNLLDVGVEEKTAARLNEWLRKLGLLDDVPESVSFVVRGHVTGASKDQVVRAYDKDFRSEEFLAESPIDAQGNYAIRYTVDRFKQAEKGTADLRVAVCEPGGSELVSSGIHFNAGPETTIDLIAGPGPAVPSEYERYMADLERVLQEVALIDIDGEKAEDKQKDFDFLAGDTGIDRQHIAWLVQAAVCQEQSRSVDPAIRVRVSRIFIPAAVFYGWFRQGLPTGWEPLRLQRISTLRKALLDAIDRNIIPGKLREDAENILARIPNPQIRELATLLGVTALPQEKMRAVLAQADGVATVSDEVLAQLVEQNVLAPHEAQFVGLSVSLHRLAGGEQPLVSAMLNSEFFSVNTGKLQQARDLALLEPEDWEREIVRIGSPAPEGMALAEYARSLAMEAVSAFPHSAFVQRATRIPIGIKDKLNTIQPLLDRNKDAIANDFDALDLTGVSDADREAFRAAHTNLKRFANLHPGLGLHAIFSEQNGAGTTVEIAGERVGWLRTVFELNPEVSFLSLDYLPDSVDLKALDFGDLPKEARGRVLQDLRAHQRIYSVTNNAIPAQEIMEAGFHSASAIALARVADFAGKTGLPEAEARVHHEAARELANGAALQWIKLYDVARDKATTPIRVIPSPNECFLPLTGFQELINNQPWCECEHCQSVLSPAAYFVDLMYYIEQHILIEGFNNGREQHPLYLQVRRPDLWELELTCKNTNEYVPYLDLVNEILEKYIKDTVSLAVGKTVYQYLAEQEGSFKQPFTSPIERLEILLGHFGLSRYDVAKAMGSDKAIRVRARLKISQKEYDLITIARTNASDPASTIDRSDLPFFLQMFKMGSMPGVLSPDSVIQPTGMQCFVRATGLAHEVVESVLNTRFVNADGSSNPKIEVVFGKLHEDDVQNNAELVKHVTLRRLDRIHRFVRLWRTLPWTIQELDYVLTRLASQNLANGIDVPALEQIVDLLDINEAWSLPIEELLALYDVIPREGLREPTALFDRLFNQAQFVNQDGRWPDQTNQLAIRFVHPAWKKISPPGVSYPENNTLSRLLAGLQIGDKELVELIEGLAAVPVMEHQPAVLPPASNPRDESILLSIESIGILYRHASLMRLLKITVTDFIKLINLTPRIGGQSQAAVRYIGDLVDLTSVIEFSVWQRSSAFALDEIAYLTDPAIPNGSLDPAKLASGIVATVKAEKSLEFADTLFTQIGLTDLQSRKIVLDNLDKVSRTEAFQVLSGGINYRLKAGFDPSGIPRLIDHSINGKRVINLLGKYHPIHVLDVLLGSALNSSPEETKVLRELAYSLSAADAMEIVRAIERRDDETSVRKLADRLIAADMKAIALAIQGDSDKTRLTALIADMLRYRVLFKSKAFDLMGLNFVRKNRAVVFGPPATPPDNVITTQVIRNVAAYVALATATDAAFTTASGPADIDAIQKVVKGLGAATEQELAKTLRTDKTRIGALKPHLIPLPGNPFDALGVLARCLVFTEQMGVSGETLKLIASDTFDGLSRAAEDVFGAFRAKYPEEKTFQEKMEPFEDRLRTRKRDGLVDFVVSKSPDVFSDPNTLYEYFLIDVLLEGCARTSRVVAAISSLQLYVHRVLMNLEKSADLVLNPITNKVRGGVIARFQDSNKREEWYWREHYRVWEANRKVFLYPENYIEPELRDDKTPLFEELEETLLQQEIGEQNVLDAFAKYLTGFDELTNLSVAGSFLEVTQKGDRLHLFGVTAVDPPAYYHRTVELLDVEHPSFGSWTKMEIQIPVRRISPVIYIGRIYVFWVDVMTRSKTDFKGGDSTFWGYTHKLTVSYSMLRLDGTWSAPQKLAIKYADTELSSAALDSSVLVPDPCKDEGETIRIPIFAPWLPVIEIPTAKAFMPRYDNIQHAEAMEGYTLRGAQWELAYPSVTDGRLFLTLRNFRLTGEVDVGRNQLRVIKEDEMVPSEAAASVLSAEFLPSPNLDDADLYEHDFPDSNGALSSISACAGRTIPTLPTGILNAVIAPDLGRSWMDHIVQNFAPWNLRRDSSPSRGGTKIVSLPNKPVVTPVNGRRADVIVAKDFDYYVIHQLQGATASYRALRLSTNIGDQLRANLALKGIDGLLNTEKQAELGESQWILGGSAHLLAAGGRDPFAGAYGGYLRETFFQIPFLIANHLNSQQKFAETQRWYHYIFNPTAADMEFWRYREFRGPNKTSQSLREMLTAEEALAAYRAHPFSPHAIARLRLSAYQKSIVMKYIDNLLDWGDSLFNQFTMESVNEATMLYAMAQDILGPRPAALGSCGEGKVFSESHKKNYSTIRPGLGVASDFLIDLEPPPALFGRPMAKLEGVKFVIKTRQASTHASTIASGSQPASRGPISIKPVGAGPSTTQPWVGGSDFNQTGGTYWTNVGGTPLKDLYATGSGVINAGSTIFGTKSGASPIPDPGNIDFINPGSGHAPIGVGRGDKIIPAGNIPVLDIKYDLHDKYPPDMVIPVKNFPPRPNNPLELVQSKTVFCIPPNKDLSAYWGRVEDRLFKIRNCMDIAGVRRRLELFSPEIDPRLLVRMKAEGLTLDDVLNSTSGNLPPYRFTYLIDKAKQYAGTLQSFGSQLLSALEKRDGEELGHLRAVHEQNLLKMRTKMTQLEIDAAEDTIEGLRRQRAAVEYRRDYYNGLVQEGLSAWERTQQISRHLVTGLHIQEANFSFLCAVARLVPQLGAPTAMKYGGVEVGGSMASFALAMQALAQVSEAVSASAGLEATFQRRGDEWKHQGKVIEHELKQLEKQITAAEIRRDIASHSLEVHQRTIDQTEEIFDFFREKFSNFDRYTLLSKRLRGLYRLAFNSALSMAKMAEQAYRAERTDDNTLLDGNYWDADNAGLLAGERLLIDLQGLERQYIETNYRQLEVEQSFSLAQLAPDKLATLRLTGECNFKIPEWFFDLTYPGQYRRRLKAVRLTIPCVTGPYTNVGATLSLERSEIRLTALDPASEPTPVPLRHTVKIASSKAQYDSGVFDFSFRDERYMPFEGAGAISTWELSLPKTLRVFDYGTISDAVLHLSYTADFDGTLKEKLEKEAEG